MARFKPQTEGTTVTAPPSSRNYPFKNVYGCAEGNLIYINMEAVEGLKKGMTTLRDIAVIIDISGSMRSYYLNKSIENMTKQIVDALAWADDDGIDLYFFANGLVYETNVSNALQVTEEIQTAMNAKGAWGSTMPTAAFRKFCEQIKAKKRAGTVLFLTDGAMDDGGKELKAFYQNYLHTEFKTRDYFYCYAVEFGRMAFGALNVLDGLFAPEQGPEDLFDLESSDNIDNIANILKQVGGMSAVGSDVELSASVNGNAKIDMVNTDLIEGGMSSISGAINQVMSFRVNSSAPFELTIRIAGYDSMVLKVEPKGIDVDIKII